MDDDVMAEREYTLPESDPPISITITLRQPRKRQSDGRFECEVTIIDPDNTDVRRMNGEDAFEALQLGLIYLGTTVKHINEQHDGALTWRTTHPEDLGLPTYPDFSLKAIMNA